MPNLVGIGNSQVPTNAMLGGLAYQDSVGEIDLEEIKAKTGDTAVDIFVYDTRKDSDGGAWRHRTQNTTWYNEGTSATRGARKEFPSIAVIVIETYELIIYDADDSNLPLWMRFEFNELEAPSANMGKTPFGLGYTNAYPHNNLNLSCVHMLNGHLFIGANRASNTNQLTAAFEVNFISEIMHEYLHYPVTAAQVSKWKLAGKVIDRNRTDHSTHPDTRYGSGAGLNEPKFLDVVNDVDMKILPNAPIDESTGLPRPTIALATDGGISIIKDDKNISTTVDIYPTGSATIESQEIYFTESNNIAFTHDGNWIYFFPIPIGNASSTYYNGIANFIGRFTDTRRDWVTNGIPINTADNGITNFLEDRAIGHTKGVEIIDINEGGLLGNGMHCGIATDFNTGWQHGDIKLATLSTIDNTNVTGSELLANPGPSFSNTTNWYLDASNKDTGTIATLTVSSGRLVFTHSDTNAYWDGFGTSFSCTVGEVYVVKADIHSATNMNVLRISNTASQHDEDINVLSSNVAGVHAHTFTATATTMYLHWNGYTDTSAMQLNSVSVRIAEEDRSVNDNGLQVFGTINKKPVATGAELVAYSNFSNSNYLLQPYNSDLNFTDTMSIMLWVNGWVGSDSLLHRGPGTTRNSKTSFHLYCSYDYNYRITFTTDGSSEQTFSFNQSANLIGWYHLCYTLSDGTVRGFLNGEEQTMSSTSFTGNIFSQATDKNGLWVGTGPVGGPATTASLALLRLSATAPSAAQIKKIYDDEKYLFTPNSKCTLYGASNAVVALAHDRTTNILHAGTSSGRSDFRGLNRINNTTTAVTTMISASNGLIAEQ